jgi:hypothetical protein
MSPGVEATEVAVSVTVLYMSMSADGYIAGANDDADHGLGDGGERLHDWFVTWTSSR